MNLIALKLRLQRLLAAQTAALDPPTALVILPDDERGPDTDARPFPRANRVGSAAIVVYDPHAGPPTTEEITRLVQSLNN